MFLYWVSQITNNDYSHFIVVLDSDDWRCVPWFNLLFTNYIESL